MANVGQTVFYQLYSPFVKLLKIVGGIGDLGWFVAEPFYHISYTDEELFLLFLWIRIVVTKVAEPVVRLCVTVT